MAFLVVSVAATPPVPEKLHTNFFHAHVNGLKQYVRVGQYGRGDVEWIPAAGWRDRVERPLCPAEQGPTAEIMMVTHDRARAREVLPIAERYEAACQAIRSETGYDAANDAWEAAVERKEELQREILSASPQGLADLLVQAETAKARDYPQDDAPALIAAIQSLAAQSASAG